MKIKQTFWPLAIMLLAFSAVFPRFWDDRLMGLHGIAIGFGFPLPTFELYTVQESYPPIGPWIFRPIYMGASLDALLAAAALIILRHKLREQSKPFVGLALAFGTIFVSGLALYFTLIEAGMLFPF